MNTRGKILVIDDEPESRKMLENWLREQGYDYIFVESDERAQTILEHRTFDTIMYTHEFPYSSKARVVKRIRVQFT